MRSGWASAVVLAAAGTAAWAGGIDLRLDRAPEQGGLVVGRVTPGATVSFRGRTVRVSPGGLFVVGFGRDASASATLLVSAPGEAPVRRRLEVGQREYRVQHIDGLPPRKVTPAEADLKRIRAEIALVKAARRRDDARTDFAAGFDWPLIGRISGVYGSQRVLNGKPRRPHYGVDIAAPTGTPVRAPADGVVSVSHPDMFYSGATLLLDHGHGVSSVFMHLDRILVANGQSVKRGEIVAEVGASGRATGPHLHWGMNWFGVRLDPALIAGPMPVQ